MTERGQIRNSGPQTTTTSFSAVCEIQPGRGRDLSLVDLNALQIQGQGYFIPRDMARLQTELRDNEQADTSAVREQIAERADDTTVRPPEQYTQLGRYTEAATDADAREGFRGDRVRAAQQRLVDGGFLTGDNAVDGFWGPETQAAHERSLAAERNAAGGAASGDAQSTSEDATARAPVQHTAYQPVADPDATARGIVDDMRTGNTDAVNRTLINARNADLREINQRLPRNADDSYNIPLADVRGRDSHYRDLMTRVLRGQRNEGDEARADSPQVDELMDQVLRARVGSFSRGMGATRNIGNALNGTDESAINQVFARASGAQLQALDERIREGVRDENGDTVQFTDGLAGLIRSEIGDGAHRDALLAMLNRPLD